MAESDRVATTCIETLRTLVRLGEHLDDDQWAASTDCPEWTVGDVYGHIAGLEHWIVDGAAPFTEPLQEWIDAHVDSRRGRSRQEVLDELGALLADRQLKDLSEQTFSPVLTAVVPTELALTLRAFDLFTHEHDIRRAVGRPGDLGGHGAEITRNLVLAGLPKKVVKAADARPGTTFRLTVMGELQFDAAVHVDDAGRGSLSRPWQPGRVVTTHATMSWEAFARLGAGRGTRADHDILITGDQELGERVIAVLNVAP